MDAVQQVQKELGTKTELSVARGHDEKIAGIVVECQRLAQVIAQKADVSVIAKDSQALALTVAAKADDKQLSSLDQKVKGLLTHVEQFSGTFGQKIADLLERVEHVNGVDAVA